MIIDLPPPAIWLPPKPAIVRANTLKDVKPAMFAAPMLMGGRVSPSIACVAYNSNASNPSNNFSWGGQAFGAADTTRTLYLIAYSVSANIASDTDWVSSVSIGGNGATKIFDPGSASNSGITIWRAALATGTSGTVSITRSTGNGFEAILWALFAAYNLSSTTPVHARGPSGGSLTLNTTPGGVAGGFVKGSSSGFTWAGMTEAFDTNGGVGGAYGMSGATTENITGSTLNITISGPSALVGGYVSLF